MGRFRSSTAAVFRPGATATKDHRGSFSYVPVFGSSSQYVRTEVPLPPEARWVSAV